MDLREKIWDVLGIKQTQSPPPWIGVNRFTRVDMASLFKDLGYGIGAEVGVRYGYYSRVLCDKIPSLKLYCIDPWGESYSDERVRFKMDKGYFRARRNLAGYDVEFIKKKSMEALPDIKDESLDFVYIDAAHDFDNVMMDIIGWSKKVRTGGIVSGHDYSIHPRQNFGVIDATQAYTKAHRINEWYITHIGANGIEGETPSWFWVKK
ncbi:MAG TPA: class I SAM-dependent methyltransferase [Candidatus Syntrophosphaera sp.]|jgi:predicted O-methyltransferase YrrM|nr:class I SAM-dependent methyltransferase [Candidatus Syntrophosphaera sp.]